MLETFTTIATTFGLPVALLAVLAFFCYKMYQENQANTKELIDELQAQNKEDKNLFFNQLASFQATMEKFQQTLDRIDMRLEYLEKNQCQ